MKPETRIEMTVPGNLATRLQEVGLDPRDLVIYVSSGCNLRCRHCYVGDALLGRNLRYEAHSLLEFIWSIGPLERLTIVGGEPLLHPRINEILLGLPYERIRETRLTSNLTVEPRSGFDDWAKLPLTLCISLDGDSAELHDRLRGKGAFDSTVEHLTRALRSGCDVEITHTITKENILRFDHFLRLCFRIGVRKLNLHRVSLQGNALANRELQVTPTEWVQFCARLTAMVGRMPSRAERLIVRYPLLFATQQMAADLRNSGRYHDHASGSFYGAGHRIVLYPDGKLYISSEAFGTESHFASIASGGFELHGAASNELALAKRGSLDIEELNPLQAGDENYPAVLSVSFKNFVVIGREFYSGNTSVRMHEGARD